MNTGNTPTRNRSGRSGCVHSQHLALGHREGPQRRRQPGHPGARGSTSRRARYSARAVRTTTPSPTGSQSMTGSLPWISAPSSMALHGIRRDGALGDHEPRVGLVHRRPSRRAARSPGTGHAAPARSSSSDGGRAPGMAASAPWTMTESDAPASMPPVVMTAAAHRPVPRARASAHRRDGRGARSAGPRCRRAG